MLSLEALPPQPNGAAFHAFVSCLHAISAKNHLGFKVCSANRSILEVAQAFHYDKMSIQCGQFSDCVSLSLASWTSRASRTSCYYKACCSCLLTSYRRGDLASRVCPRACPSASSAPTSSNSSVDPHAECVHGAAPSDENLEVNCVPHGGLCDLRYYPMVHCSLSLDTNTHGGAGTNSRGKRRCPPQHRAQNTHMFLVSLQLEAEQG
jgi:hypothetical protein